MGLPCWILARLARACFLRGNEVAASAMRYWAIYPNITLRHSKKKTAGSNYVPWTFGLKWTVHWNFSEDVVAFSAVLSACGRRSWIKSLQIFDLIESPEPRLKNFKIIVEKRWKNHVMPPRMWLALLLESPQWDHYNPGQSRYIFVTTWEWEGRHSDVFLVWNMCWT